MLVLQRKSIATVIKSFAFEVHLFSSLASIYVSFDLVE